nr:hypothetical protein [uncultured Pedobacter sp.]
MRLNSILLLLFQLIVGCALSQDKKKDSVNRQDVLEEEYKRLKDSLSNYTFIPAVSSVLIKEGEWEFNLFSSLNSANRYRDNEGELLDLSVRQSYLFNTLQVTYGISKKSRVNVGLDINTIMGRIDQDRNSSIFRVFDPNVSGRSQYASAISGIGPRVRWRPFSKNYNLTLQSSLIFGLSIKDSKTNVLGLNQSYFATQLLYNTPVTKYLSIFSQLGLQYAFKKGDAVATFYSPLAVYVSYFIPRKTVPFVLINYVPGFEKNNKWSYSRYFCQAGAGIQYQIYKNLLINSYYAANIAGKNYAVFNNYNVNIRFLHH